MGYVLMVVVVGEEQEMVEKNQWNGDYNVGRGRLGGGEREDKIRGQWIVVVVEEGISVGKVELEWKDFVEVDGEDLVELNGKILWSW